MHCTILAGFLISKFDAWTLRSYEIVRSSFSTRGRPMMQSTRLDIGKWAWTELQVFSEFSGRKGPNGRLTAKGVDNLGWWMGQRVPSSWQTWSIMSLSFSREYTPNLINHWIYGYSIFRQTHRLCLMVLGLVLCWRPTDKVQAEPAETTQFQHSVLEGAKKGGECTRILAPFSWGYVHCKESPSGIPFWWDDINLHRHNM